VKTTLLSRRVLLCSIPLFFIHGLEEGFTGILSLDAFFRRLGNWAPYALAIELLAVAAVLLLAASNNTWVGEKVKQTFILVAGVLYLFESDHIIRAVLKGGYYSGVITATLIVGFGLLYLYLLGLANLLGHRKPVS
jgi:hypothetical protein